MKFKLEPVFKLRESVEKAKKRELGIAISYKHGLDNKKNILLSHKVAAITELRQQIIQSLEVERLKQLRIYSNYINGQLQKINTEIVKASEIIEEKKIEVAEAMKQKKVIEKLKEIKIQEIYEEQIRQEASLLDEIISYKYTTKERGE